MQLVDKNGIVKVWNTLKHEYDFHNNFYFQWMLLILAILTNWKTALNTITLIAIQLQLLTRQESLRFKK